MARAREISGNPNMSLSFPEGTMDLRKRRIKAGQRKEIAGIPKNGNDYRQTICAIKRSNSLQPKGNEPLKMSNPTSGLVR